MTLVMTATAPAVLTSLVAPWATFYSDSKTAATIVVFLHVAPLIVGGGLAIATDRATLHAIHLSADERARRLDGLAAAHRTVIGSLILVTLSGIAMLAADLDTFLGSWVFWLKMGLVFLLLANGGMMTRIERTLVLATAETSREWRRLRFVALTSIALWLITAFLGVALTNAA